MSGARAVALASVVAAACAGSVESPGGGGPAVEDGGTTFRDAPPAGGPMWVDAAIGSGGANDCGPRVANPTGDSHNTGRDCRPCHGEFTVSGTVYTSPSSNTGYGGATVTVIGANGVTTDIVVAPNGNFYTTAPIAFPALVKVSACPYETRMQATITNGSCNAGACHSQQSGPAGQIHLP